MRSMTPASRTANLIFKMKPCYHCKNTLNESTNLCKICTNATGKNVKAFETCDDPGCSERGAAHTPLPRASWQ